MKPFNRFDMEQQIMNCWNICEDLDTLMEGVLERDMSQDRITNALLGMKELYQLKFETLWESFEAMTSEAHQAKQYHYAYTNYVPADDNMNTTTARGEYLSDEGN
jgi:hypothetical protein